MKSKKPFLYLLILTLIITFGIFLYRHLEDKEVTKVTLKCSDNFMLFKNESPRTGYLIRITKKMFDESPVHLLHTYPNSLSIDLDPGILGLYETSPKLNDIPFKKKYSLPDYYVFTIDPDSFGKCNNCKGEPVPTVTYINRDTLEIETTFMSDQTVISTGKCEIVDNRLFDDEWKLKAEKIKKERKI